MNTYALQSLSKNCDEWHTMCYYFDLNIARSELEYQNVNKLNWPNIKDTEYRLIDATTKLTVGMYSRMSLSPV
jgi:hypothetical protein